MLIDTNGNDGRILTTAPGVGEQLHPDWAPQGSALTFAVDETDGTRDIWTASLDGSMTTVSGVNATHPRLQPSPGGG